MSALPASRPAALIPAQRQAYWKAPAVANFFLGGLGAGLYVVTLLAGGGPAVRTASWLGPLLVALGFGAVALEAGRPLRGPRVLRRVGTSWMSRELVLGGAFIAAAIADIVIPSATVRGLAGAAAIGFVLAQGFILREARAIAAWSVGIVPVVFLASALASGAGLALVLETLAGRTPPAATLGLVLPLLAPALVVWIGYLGWSDEPVFRTGTAVLRTGATATRIVVGAYVAPFVACALAIALPELARMLAGLAGAFMVAGQADAKWSLVRDAGQVRPITLPGLALGTTTHQRRPS